MTKSPSLHAPIEKKESAMANQQDDHEEIFDSATNTVIQLGFSVKIKSKEQLQRTAHRTEDYSYWDGGQIGGAPVWLEPCNVPKGPLICHHCDCSMRFLCQLYAPLDDFDNADEGDASTVSSSSAPPDRAFHRSLYVFGCPQCAEQTTGSIRVLRSQLTRENPYYPVVPDDDDEDAVEEVNWRQHTSSHWNVSLCAVCGMACTSKCPLQNKYFCCKEHQKEYKKYAYNTSSNDVELNPPYLPSVYNRSELVVEEEPPLDENTTNNDGNPNTMFDAVDDNDSDSDEDLEQDDLNRMVGSNKTTTQDAATTHFYQRVKERPNCQDQCLRYDRWSTAVETTPLWIRQEHQPADIPPCPYCHAPRRFEFQLMPQLLHYLLQGRRSKESAAAQLAASREYQSVMQAVNRADSMVLQASPEQIPPALVEAKDAAVQRMQEKLTGGENTEIDWGVVAVYTCTNSCSTGNNNNKRSSNNNEAVDHPDMGEYREEYAWKQPSL